jgi:hypothetical protein
LHNRFGGLPLAVFGLRFGAAVALLASGTLPALDALVLWQPVMDGEAHLAADFRKKLMKEMLTYGGSRGTREDLVKRLQGGRPVDLDGYELTSRHYSDICAVDTLAAAASARLHHAVLVGIGPSDKPGDSLAKLAAALPSEIPPAVGAIRMQSFWNQIGMIDCRDLVALTMALERKCGVDGG